MPASGRRQAGNLPGESSSFVDRGRERREVRRLLGDARLVTLTGVGGAGKTRLALQVGAEVGRAFGDGVWFVDLTELNGSGDPDGLAFAVMAALGMQEADGGPTVPTLIDHLEARRALLLLDNCEHLLPACAALAVRLLQSCPTVKILATSREPLAVHGENIFGVPPLPVPDPGHGSSFADVAQSAAVSLLVVRARAAEPRFALTEANQEAVVDLCRRLDGLPLAIELAAAWMRSLTPPQILDLLAERFAMLSRGSRAAPGRQQTMRACVDWSFDLCTEPERLLWARLSVFSGGFELDAVQGVCADETLPASDLLEVVSGLVDKSILDRDDPPERPGASARYRMLETLRDYGAERLAASGERAVLRRRHRDWHERLAARASAEWISDRQTYWLERLDREYPNLRAAVEHSLAAPQAEGALRLLVALPPQWRFSRGLYGEEVRWLDQALAKVTAPSLLRARALLLAAHLVGRGGDLDMVVRRLAEGERLAREVGDATGSAFAAFLGGAVALLGNDVVAATASLERGLSLLPPEPNPDFVPGVRLQLLNSLGVAAGLIGDYDRARRCYQEILAATEPVGEGVNRFAARWGLGLIAWLSGDPDEAAGQLRQGLRVGSALRWNTRYATFAVEILAWSVARQGRPRLAAVLLGAAERLRSEYDKPITTTGWMLADHDACERHTREALGDAAFDEAFRHGLGLSGGEVVTAALDDTRRPDPEGRPPSRQPAPLTRREREIADLVAAGLSNRQIAARLVISRRTVESHVEHILTKLGFSSRAQVAAWTASRSDGRDRQM